MEITGLVAEPDRPGHSWLPLIQAGSRAAMGEGTDRPDWAFSEYHGNFFKQDWYMLRRGDYKYTYYVNDRPSLYNLADDPREMNDLAGDPKYAEVLKEFESLLRGITDPEAVSLQAKRDLGLIGKNGEDYTLSLTDPQLQEMIKQGVFANEPEFPQWEEKA
jgi:choline-sulfatase